MTDNESRFDDALRRVNPIPPNEVEGLVSEAQTSELLRKIYSRTRTSASRSIWKKLLARLGLGSLVIVGLVGVTATAAQLSKATSNDPSSAGCYTSTSGALYGIDVPLKNSPIQTCESYWKSHRTLYREAGIASCVLKSGIVGVFALGKDSEPCAKFDLSSFSGYSNGELVRLETSALAKLRTLSCPTPSQVRMDVEASMREYGIKAWIIRSKLGGSKLGPGECASFRFASGEPLAIQIVSHYVGPELPTPPWESFSRSLWQAWSASQRSKFTVIDWKLELSTPLCRVTASHVHAVRSKGESGIPKGIETAAVSGISSCKP